MTAALVPELYVGDITRSLHFYVDILGFVIPYERPADRFAYLALGAAEIMIEQPTARRWQMAEPDYPFGQGINLQIAVTDASALQARVASYGLTPFLPLEKRRYDRQKDTVEVAQFIISDPDGYLLRFSQTISVRQR